MSNISKEKVEHIAKLARIELTKQEKEKFFKELSSILDYVEQLKQVDTSKVKSVAQITGLGNVMREDTKYLPRGKTGKIPDTRYKLLKQAPQKKGDYIQVPKILE